MEDQKYNLISWEQVENKIQEINALPKIYNGYNWRKPTKKAMHALEMYCKELKNQQFIPQRILPTSSGVGIVIYNEKYMSTIEIYSKGQSTLTLTNFEERKQKISNSKHIFSTNKKTTVRKAIDFLITGIK